MPDNFANSIAKTLNSVSRATGGAVPYNKGAVSVQTNSDMIDAQAISDAVPRRSELSAAAPDARDRQTRDGVDHTKTHDSSSAPDNTEGPSD